MARLVLMVVLAGVAGAFRSGGPGRRPASVVAAKKKQKGFSTAPQKTTPKPAQPGGEKKSTLLTQLLAEEALKEDRLKADMDDLRARDAFVRDNSDAGRIPDSVATRMGLRMAVLGGVPIFGGIGLFVFFYVQSTSFDNVFQPTQVAFFTTLPWVLGLLGVTYGILSSSWDEDRDGSLLGLDEVKTNLERVYDGLKRSAKDADLRDRS